MNFRGPKEQNRRVIGKFIGSRPLRHNRALFYSVHLISSSYAQAHHVVWNFLKMHDRAFFCKGCRVLRHSSAFLVNFHDS